MIRNKLPLFMILAFIILCTGLVYLNKTVPPSKKNTSHNQTVEPQKGQTAENGKIKLKQGTPSPSVVNAKYSSEDAISPVEVANRVIVKLSPGIDPAEIAEMVNAEIVRIGPLQFTTLALPANQIEGVINRLKKTPGVLSVQPVHIFKTSVAQTMDVNPTDRYYAKQWGLTKAEVQKAWDLGVTGQGVIVAVVDTGVDLNHPDLKDNILSGYNAITGLAGGNTAQDKNGHGTHVCGIIAAEQNGIGIVGVAYQAKILPIKALTSDGAGSDDCIADGIVWAADHNAQIINLSLGSSDESDILREALQYAFDKGCLIVAAGGNAEPDSNLTAITFPAADSHVLAVTATDTNDQIASFSLPGPQAAIAAPGVDIISDYWANGSSGYASMDGTSMASPFAAGIAALVWSVHPDLSAQQIRTCLENSALDLDSAGRDNNYGFGRVDAYWAIRFADTPKTYFTTASLDWAGGVVQEGTGGTTVSLKVPARAFGLDPNLTNTVSIGGAEGASDLAAGIQPMGDAVSIQWNGSVHKLLELSLTTSGTQPDADYAGYIYHWSGSRWIRIGGGVNAPTIIAGITEPGIYRIGYSLLPNNQRIGGIDRIETSIMISQSQFPNGSDTVILARSDNFADALSGVPLAYKVHGPVLLTTSAQLLAKVKTEIQRLAPKKIVLLGGTGALSTSIEQQLRMFFPVQRLGGDTRYETAALIASELGTIGRAVLVNGNVFPDAISVASTAAQLGIPILLTDSSTLPKETDTSLRQLLVSETTVCGGEGVVSSSIFNNLPNPTRISGNDRYATAAAILAAYPPQGISLFFATGENFPDALSGGVIAALNQTSLVLIPYKGPSSSEIAVFKTWQGKKVYILGNTGVIPDTSVQQIEELIKY